MINEQLSFKYSLQNEEVLYAEEDISIVSFSDIKNLIQMAKRTMRKRIRLCAHPSSLNHVHDMLIIHFHDTYVRPHKHLRKDETFHIIEGRLKIVIFHDDGSIFKIIDLNEYSSKGNFFYRMSKSYYHTVIPLSQVVVFHETTKGPFVEEDTIFPTWAPDGENKNDVKNFLKEIKQKFQ